jgi:hypothetical protein
MSEVVSDAGSKPPVAENRGAVAATEATTGGSLVVETLETIGTTVKAMVKKDAEHLEAIGRKLLQAKELINETKGATWEGWLKTYGLKKSWANTLVRIARGEDTVEKMRARVRDAMAAKRQREQSTGGRNVRAGKPVEPARSAAKPAEPVPFDDRAFLERLEHAGVNVTPARDGYRPFVLWSPPELAHDHGLKKALTEVAERFEIHLTDWPGYEEPEAAEGVKAVAAQPADAGEPAPEHEDDGLDIPEYPRRDGGEEIRAAA